MRTLMIIGVLMSCVACATPSTPKSAHGEPSLYQRIGGEAVLKTVVNETLDEVSQDPRTKRSFEGVKMSTLKQSLTNFLCLKTGGECEYEGETMKKSHADSHITTAEFEILVDVLRQRLDANGVGTKEKNQLLRILAPMKSDVVTN